jgi:predicted transcriptional regulator of viral defense system
MRADRQDLRIRLFHLAGTQSGYFTAAQAKELGYSYQAQKHHVDHGNWVRVDRGIFRVRGWPTSPFDSLVRWVLWSRNLGVVSHETAATVWAIGVANPSKVHLTVPQSFRSKDEAVVLHKAELTAEDITRHEFVTVTTPLRTVLDLAESNFDEDLVLETLDDALRRGLVSRRQLRRRLVESSPKVQAMLGQRLDDGRTS